MASRNVLRADGGEMRRFVSAKIDPDNRHGLAEDHPAVVQGRTLFPSTVVNAAESPRLFVSGHNNPKLGAKISKGPRAGWPIYHLTLEERATCPRSCAIWEGCYGNTMHLARRHRDDGHLIDEMLTELHVLNAKHPGGFLVRLHTLGDFYSVDYVMAWWQAMRLFPALHVFGYTARGRKTDPIGQEIERTISLAGFSRFSIRWSTNGPVPQGSTVFTEDPGNPNVVMCPAQVEVGDAAKTECCGTCGLCWAPAARHKTIGFLEHGMKRARGHKRRPLQAKTAGDRLESVDAAERARIAAAYGAKFR